MQLLDRNLNLYMNYHDDKGIPLPLRLYDIGSVSILQYHCHQHTSTAVEKKGIQTLFSGN